MCNPRCSAAATPCIGGCWFYVSTLISMHPSSSSSRNTSSIHVRPTRDFARSFLAAQQQESFSLCHSPGGIGSQRVNRWSYKAKSFGLMAYTYNCMYDHICIGIYIIYMHVCIGLKYMCIWTRFRRWHLKSACIIVCASHVLYRISYCYRTHVDMSNITINDRLIYVWSQAQVQGWRPLVNKG